MTVQNHKLARNSFINEYNNIGDENSRMKYERWGNKIRQRVLMIREISNWEQIFKFQLIRRLTLVGKKINV